MKNNSLDRLKESKKKIDLRSGKHICMLLVWIGIALVVSFQPESMLRTWVLLISKIACVWQIWTHGRCIGASEIIEGIIENLSKNQSSSDTCTKILQGNGVENKKKLRGKQE